MEAKLIGLRECFKEINELKFRTLLFVCNCILLARSTNLFKASDYAAHLGSGAMPRSNHIRLLRFFATGVGELLQKGVMRAVIRMAMQKGKASCLVMDRTEWEHHNSWRNLLVLGLVFDSYLIPLVWVDLAYHGASDPDTRLGLLQRMADWWPVEDVPLNTFPLVADREFGGEDWLLKVAKLGFNFVVRLKSNRHMGVWFNDVWRLKDASLSTIKRYVRQKGQNNIEVVIAGEYVCRLICLDKPISKRDKEPCLFLLTNLDTPQQASEFYRRRYSIECCFKHLKSNGFDLEKQGFCKPHQVEIITAVVVLMFTACVVQGHIQQIKTQTSPKKSPVKTYKDGSTYPARSLFRTGLTSIIAKAHNPFGIHYLVNELLSWFPTTYDY